MIQIFYTINPHINNLSIDRLKSDFRYCLQKYYRKTLGQRYYKHKDKQYDIGIFPEIGDREIKEPHLHILVDLPLNELKRFYNIISSNMHKIYPSLTDKIKVGDNSANLWKYCTKEDKGLIVKSDLLEK